MRRRILNPEWFYDRFLNFLDDRFNKAPDGQTKRAIEETISDLLKFHVFLIGPATLETLVNEKPSRYDYVENGQLPFNEVFFEFAEPFDMNMPFLNKQANAMGMEFRKVEGPAKFADYGARIYFQPEKGKIYSLGITFGRNYGEGFFSGALLDEVDPKNKQILFSIDLNERKLNYTEMQNPAEFAERILEAQKVVDPFLFNSRECVEKAYTDPKARRILFPNEADISSFPNGQIFTQVPNLCVNLINYINAHNVTVLRKERPIEYIEKTEGKKKKRTGKNHFHLIIVKDEVVEESDEPRKVGRWTLQERIYVRGHFRYYRDEKREIRLATFINPYVKGPPNAPWREQRYQVLAEKLLREQEMMKK